MLKQNRKERLSNRYNSSTKREPITESQMKFTSFYIPFECVATDHYTYLGSPYTLHFFMNFRIKHPSFQ
jgi:hypothetical protein